MRASMSRGPRMSGLVLLALSPLVLVAGQAFAQVNPLWDHYKVYDVEPTPYVQIHVRLTDQFGQSDGEVGSLELFMNPTEKQLPPPGGTFGISDPNLHYTWRPFAWLGGPPTPPGFIVTATDQFGDHTMRMGGARFLLAPARKDEPGEPPVANHYLCYESGDAPLNQPVLLTDQFGPWSTTILTSWYFCNPVQKLVGETIYPIVDTDQHYICYEFSPQDPTPHAPVLTDQFVADQPVRTVASRFLCVPAYKTGVTATQRDTWGKLKLLYR